ncbi:MAG TPA: GNAT family N-acetyltransferase [Thermoplasmata archaeon]|nr:GNAT family N-acetyltransferase [Thermoplasmata archaeon]
MDPPDIRIVEATADDIDVMASVLAPAFRRYVDVLVGDVDRAMRVIPGIIRAMDGMGHIAYAGARPVGAILVTYDEPRFLLQNALTILRVLGPRRAVRAALIARDYLRTAPRRPPDEGWVEAVGVDEGFRRRGIGSLLIGEAVADLQARGRTSMGLAVVRGSPAVMFYERLGFEHVTSFSNRLGDWHYMRLRL